MASFLNDLRLTISLSLILSTLFISIIIYLGDFQGIIIFWIWFLRLVHVIAGIIWVGLLFYFNFIQIPNMVKIPDNHCLLYTSPSPRDKRQSRMPSSA